VKKLDNKDAHDLLFNMINERGFSVFNATEQLGLQLDMKRKEKKRKEKKRFSMLKTRFKGLFSGHNSLC